MKRNINKIIIDGVLLGIGMITLSSCLKNNKYYLNFASVGTTVEMAMAPAKAVPPPNAFYYSTDLGAGAYVDTIQYSNSAQTVPIYVNVASPEVPSSATTATLFLDTAALNALNNEYGEVNAGYYNGNFDPIPGLEYELLPSNSYQISSWQVIVPSGQRLAPLNIQINPSMVDTTTMETVDGSGNSVRIFKHNYVLPISIQSASQKVSNWKTVFVNIQVMPN